MRKREAGAENALRQPQDRTGNSGMRGAFSFNLSVRKPRQPKRAALGKMTILACSFAADAHPEGNNVAFFSQGFIESIGAAKTHPTLQLTQAANSTHSPWCCVERTTGGSGQAE